MRKVSFKNGLFCGVNEKLAVSGGFVKTAILGLSLMFFGAAAQAQTLAALPVSSAPISAVGTAKPLQAVPVLRHLPIGMHRRCVGSEPIDLTPQVWNTFVSVNQRVNSSIKAVTDVDHCGHRRYLGFPR